MIELVKCPKCTRLSDPRAESCDCGYSFKDSLYTKPIELEIPWILRAIFCLTITFYLLGDIGAFFQSYGAFRHSGIGAGDVFHIGKHPIQAFILYAYLLSAIVCSVLLRAFLYKRSEFPWLLLSYYAIAIGMPVVWFLAVGDSYTYQRAFDSALVTVIRDSVFMLPWVLYAFFSKTVKKIFVN